MKGCIPSSEKRRFHRMGLHDPIGHLAAAVHQDFIIADAICPDLLFEDGGNPVQLDRMICAADPVLMDAYGSQILALEQEEVSYIRIAAALGAGCPDTSQAEVSFYLEKRGHEYGTGSRYIRAEVPSLPWNRDPGGMLIRLREQDQIPDKICIGQGYRGRTGNLGIGNCTSRFCHTLKGCPPTADEMYRFLSQLDV